MRFIDRYLYKPNALQKALSILLLPISILYLIMSIVRRKIQRYYDFQIPIISVGNLIAGGSGKTPFLLEIAKDYNHIAVISRGYKRKSNGLVVVSINGKLQVSEEQSGDEAYLIALSLKNASVIVCKNRKKAIKKAKELGAKCVFLDDGFRFNFKKLNIILYPKLMPYFPFTLPSGMYRENPFYSNPNDIVLKEDVDYIREVYIDNPSEKMLLLSAIANPMRLEQFLAPYRTNIVGDILLSDHARFDFDFVQREFKRTGATSLLVTQKDKVKLTKCEIPLSTLVLKMHIKDDITKQIREYINANSDSTPNLAI